MLSVFLGNSKLGGQQIKGGGRLLDTDSVTADGLMSREEIESLKSRHRTILLHSSLMTVSNDSGPQ